MKAIKNLFVTLFLLLILLLLFIYNKQIVNYIMINIVYRDEILEKEANEYYKGEDYNFVKITNNYYPNNRQDILNLLYTGLERGYSELIFYCSSEYTNCIDEVDEIALDQSILSYVNNYVTTYNSYAKIYVNFNSFGRVYVKIDKMYTDEEINEINEKIDEIYNKIINDSMTDEEKIKAVHDYLLENTTYDEETANEVRSSGNTFILNSSNTAYGPLFTGKSICGGYTDAMALFLDKMGLQNIKVSSDNHIWNAVYIDGVWKHLDLTWDDPVVVNGDDVVTYDYFLISTEELKKLNDGKHNFDESIFNELKS